MPDATVTPPPAAGAVAVTPPPVGTVALAAAAPAPALGRFLNDRRTLALLLISVLGLFLELMLIRWVTTEIRIFAYLQNTVLVVCFLGLGMGCWDSRRRAFALRDLLLPLSVLVVLLSIPTTRLALGKISHLFNGFDDLLVWQDAVKSGFSQVA